MSYHALIDNNNFSNLFPIRNKREQLNTLIKQRSFSCFKLDKDLSNIVINYFKHNKIFIKHNFFSIFNKF